VRLTRQSNYAIRALVYCAVNEPELSRVADIAKSYNISELFLFKLIKPLVENGLIETVRGPPWRHQAGQARRTDHPARYDPPHRRKFRPGGMLRRWRRLPVDRGMRSQWRVARGAGRLLHCAAEIHHRRSRQQEALDSRSSRPHRHRRHDGPRRIILAYLELFWRRRIILARRRIILAPVPLKTPLRSAGAAFCYFRRRIAKI
jgi:hypothetical protein